MYLNEIKNQINMTKSRDYILVQEAVCCPNVPIVNFFGCGDWIKPVISVMFVITIYPKNVKDMTLMKILLLICVKIITLFIYLCQSTGEYLKPVGECVPKYLSKYSFPDPVISTVTTYSVAVLFLFFENQMDEITSAKYVFITLVKFFGYLCVYYYSYLINFWQMIGTVIFSLILLCPVLVFISELCPKDNENNYI